MADNNKFTHLRELYIPYKFSIQLLLKRSRDGFTPINYGLLPLPSYMYVTVACHRPHDFFIDDTIILSLESLIN
ncbi:hypothetical protein GLOIN_2v1877698 [Rhizophagus irregularis DAOM 181602=DAOM 197198]|uniref:Uncharacterized protein n=2 Tax=Rhizophagus irregularis TaxID=588596 RepID=U9UL45_RHIID|nr:hypothetical protein GLOIN_2v1877698 [Rhizophagus irregularis DAOM 181602=DAOM 197198]